jgi:4-amino-4-deoxy-L-arabinose transferase-like glycosyltransferase
MKFSKQTARLADIGWLALLAVYVFAGTMLAPFHGDEAMHIYTSHDYATAFIQKQPELLPVQPPYDIDSDARLRLLNGSVMRYSVGLAWQLAGLNERDLPPHPGWDWGLYYDQNVATGHRPSPALLAAARTVSSLYLVGSIVILFGIGWLIAGRPLAYLASLLYTLNPIILLNGRRALVESAMLCFGLAVIWVALSIAKRRMSPHLINPHPPAPSPLHREGEQENRVGLGWWAALAVTSALALASKYTGTIFVAGAFGGLFMVELLRPSSPTPLPQGEGLPMRVKQIVLGIVRLAVTGVAALALLVALSPALWSDPVARAKDLGAMLTDQVNIVVSILPDAPQPVSRRISDTLTESFMQPAQQFEQASWADAAPITAEIERYMASPLSGLQFGTLLGGLLTLLAGFGLAALFWPRLRPYSSWELSVVLAVWLLVMVANLLINPIPWQRYYLPLIPITTLLAGIGALAVYRLVRR